MKGSQIVKMLSEDVIDRIVEMAWEDRTPFEAITHQFGLTESEIIALMRYQMKLNSWRNWRARVQGRSTKHRVRRGFELGRHRSLRQRHISTIIAKR